MATIPGRQHIVHIREEHIKRYVRGHKPLCYALTILFILLMLVL